MRSKPPGLVIGACVFALAVYAAGLAATLPATIVDARLERASRGIVRLAEARGSLWSGTGKLEIREKNVRIGDSQQLAWHFQPRSLLSGHLGFEIELDQTGRQVPLTTGLSRFDLGKIDIVLPAAVLGLAEPRLVPLKLGGELALRINRLSIEGELIDGDATLQWQGATSALTTVSPLGDYELNITSSGGTMQAAMRTLQGPLQIDGKGSWKTGDASAFMANARIPASLRQQLAPLLGLIAVERNEGVFEIQLK